MTATSDAETVPSRTELPRLTSLRAFAALAVFAFHVASEHIWAPSPSVWKVGYAGVSFFFVLSGFILAWVASPTQSARKFWWRRFARIYPSHLVVLVIVLAVGYATADPTFTSVTASVLLLQAWWFDSDVAYGINNVSWSLSCEALFYALFPLIVVVLRKNRALRIGLPLVLLAVTQVIILAGQNDSKFSTINYHWPPMRLGEFALGVAAGVAMVNGWRPRIPWWAAAVVLVAGLAGTLAVLPYPSVDVVGGIAFLVVILWAASADAQGRRGLLTHRWAVYAGQISFAFYLVHYAVIAAVVDLDVSGPPGAVLALVLSTVAAIAMHHLVEKRAQRFLTR